MFRGHTLLLFRRLYHDSTFSLEKKLPVVKIANTRRGRALKERLNQEAPPRAAERSQGKKFEPFPFAITEENKSQLVRLKLSPLTDLPYEEQLAAKENYCKNALRQLAKRLYLSRTPIRLDARKLPCTVSPIVKSTNLDRYRNIEEFSIWYGHDGKTPTVGCIMFPISKHGDTVCVEPNSSEVVRESVIKLVDVLQDFIRHQAKLPVCFDLSEGGWRRMCIRSNNRDELMLIGYASPRQFKVRDIINERDNFGHFVVEKSKEAGINLKSVYFQPCPHNKCKHSSVPYELIYGEETIIETINNYKIHVSPESYMPQSTSGAELLCNTLISTANTCFEPQDPNKVRPLIIDVKCGVGLNLIHFAHIASRMIGIDSSSQAIRDARENTKLNNIENVELICGELEIVLERVLDKYANLRNEVIVICRVPSGGVHRNVAEAMRRCKKVNKIIFVSPKPDGGGCLDNLMTLCEKQSDKNPTPPFELIHATPVDVLPKVESCELIIALERFAQ